MDTRSLYQTLTFNKDFGFQEYQTPSCDCDPKRQILNRTLQDYKNRPKQQKFKVTTKPRVSYFDELAKLTVENPQPSRYKVEGNLSKRSRSASLKKVDLKVKKQTYLDKIQLFETKHKPPGVAKFDLTKYTDLGTKRFSNLKPNKEIQKFNNFDDAIKLAAQLPGPGSFNPHDQIVKIKKDKSNFKEWIKRHAQLQKKASKSLATKLGPFTYNPVKSGTFESKIVFKSQEISRWSHGTIEIRKGIRSQLREPSPCQYNTVNQWIKTSKKQKPIGNFHLLNRVSSAQNFSVYH